LALKLRATRPPAQGCGTKSVPRQGHNTPFPLERSPPASFKRLLGTRATGAAPRTGALPLPCLHCGLEPSPRWLAKLLVPCLKKRSLSGAVRKCAEKGSGLRVVELH